MSAPTPVRALVHSSTLVTAGIFMSMCFLGVIGFDYLLDLFFFVGLLTIFVSGVSAYFEPDVKKLIALRTLSQMGFCFFSLGLGLVFFTFLHILRHAIFKSCLFIQIGYVIHGSFGQQDSRNYGCLSSLRWVVQVQIFVTLACLCGLFFLSGAVRKEMVLEYYYFCS